MAAYHRPRSGPDWATANFVVLALALIPVLWMVSLSLQDAHRRPRPVVHPVAVDLGQLQRHPRPASQFLRPLINSIGIGLISTLIAVVLASMAAYAVARLRFPGKRVLIGMALLIAMFPLISLVTPLFNIERALGLFNTWPGLIIPYIAFALPLAIYTLSAFFREIPWELEKAAKMDGATPVPGVPQGHRPARRAGHGHHGDPGLPLAGTTCCWRISLTATKRPRTAPAAIAVLQRQYRQFTEPPDRSRRARWSSRSRSSSSCCSSSAGSSPG